MPFSNNFGKVIALVAVLASAFGLLGMTNQSGSGGAITNKTAPSFSATTVAGKAFQFPEALRGKPSVVLMWSTWCPYCKVLMPRLANIRAQYGVEIIAINAKERGIGDPTAFLNEAGYDFINILDGDHIAAEYDVEYLPGLFVVSPAGKIVYRRGWTDLSPGQTVADLWEAQVTEAVQSAASEFAG